MWFENIDIIMGSIIIKIEKIYVIVQISKRKKNFNLTSYNFYILTPISNIQW